MNKPLQERLVFSEPFFEKTFEEYTKEKVKLLLSEDMNGYKFFKDLNIKELQAFYQFINTFDTEIKSRNKSSGQIPNLRFESAIERKFFFERYNICHIHLLTQDVYEQNCINGGKPVKNIKDNNSKMTIEDMLDEGHTSDLYLNYQIKHGEYGKEYKVLFLSKHFVAEEWDNFKSDLQKLMDE